MPDTAPHSSADPVVDPLTDDGALRRWAAAAHVPWRLHSVRQLQGAGAARPPERVEHP